MGTWDKLKQLFPTSASDNASEPKKRDWTPEFPIKGAIEEVFNEACKNKDKNKALKCISVMEREHKYDNVVIAWEHFRNTFGYDVVEIEEKIGDTYLKKGDYKNALQHYLYCKIKGRDIEGKVYTCCKELILRGGCGETPSYWYNLYEGLFGKTGKHHKELKSLL